MRVLGRKAGETYPLALKSESKKNKERDDKWQERIDHLQTQPGKGENIITRSEGVKEDR